MTVHSQRCRAFPLLLVNTTAFPGEKMMHRSSAFWPLLLLVPLVLLGLTGCVSPCGDSVGPDLDLDLVSANGLIYLNSPASHSLYAIEMKTSSIRWNHQTAGNVLLDSDILYIDDEIYMTYAFDASV